MNLGTDDRLRALAMGQGVYFVATGVWPLVVLAAGSAAGLGAIDTIYAATGRIARIYLADAAVEAGLTSAWLAGAGRARDRPDADTARETAPAPIACVDLNGVLDAYTGWRGPDSPSSGRARVPRGAPARADFRSRFSPRAGPLTCGAGCSSTGWTAS